ncbi:MAG TPA: dienelactone hydrolase family protein [Iamia sp.]|nr:dienelactone hydrolase family protein [Iamia sp.]
MTDPVEPATTLAVPRDDGSMDMPVWLPEGGSGPGVVLVQEIFGVGEWIRAVATELAQAGYVVGAPDLYWRIAPGFAPEHDEAGIGAAFEMVGRLDVPGAVGDTVAALSALAGHDAVTGTPAVMGYCLGGTIAWLAAAEGEPAACVSYYGSGVADAAERVADIGCPTLLHFGGADPFISSEQVAIVAAAVETVERVELHVHAGAGHAFENDRAEQFHDPDATVVSRAQTLEFLRTHLAV